MTNKFTEDDFKPNSATVPSGQPNQGRRQWSMSTIYAARPHPQFDKRSTAIEWNRQYAGNSKLQVNPNDYPE